MKIMADMDAVHLGLDENEADIAEELQDFDDSFDTRSEASESDADAYELSDAVPSVSPLSSPGSTSMLTEHDDHIHHVNVHDNNNKLIRQKTNLKNLTKSNNNNNNNNPKIDKSIDNKKRNTIIATSKTNTTPTGKSTALIIKTTTTSTKSKQTLKRTASPGNAKQNGKHESNILVAATTTAAAALPKSSTSSSSSSNNKKTRTSSSGSSSHKISNSTMTTNTSNVIDKINKKDKKSNSSSSSRTTNKSNKINNNNNNKKDNITSSGTKCRSSSSSKINNIQISNLATTTTITAAAAALGASTITTTTSVTANKEPTKKLRTKSSSSNSKLVACGGSNGTTTTITTAAAATTAVTTNTLLNSSDAITTHAVTPSRKAVIDESNSVNNNILINIKRNNKSPSLHEDEHKFKIMGNITTTTIASSSSLLSSSEVAETGAAAALTTSTTTSSAVAALANNAIITSSTSISNNSNNNNNTSSYLDEENVSLTTKTSSSAGAAAATTPITINLNKNLESITAECTSVINAPTPPIIHDHNLLLHGSKSDLSDAEARPLSATFDSDTESDDSDANIKRSNGRTNNNSTERLLLLSPMDKKFKNEINKSNNDDSNATTTNTTTTGSSNNNNNNNKSYDYMTKLNYLFRDTRFFLIKSNNADNIAISKSKNVWATLPQNDANLNHAFKEARNVLLIFSVNESGKFAGFARMSAQSRRDIPQLPWILPPTISAKALGGVIELDWICRKELSFNCTSHLYNSWNEGKPVKIGRDGQEIEPKVAAELCRLFPEDEKIELTPTLRKSKETARMMREKGIRVIYKPPRSLSMRGAGRGIGSNFYRHISDQHHHHHHHPRLGRGNDSGGSTVLGPMRHKRSFVGAAGMHRPYKLPPLGMPSSMYKRSGSPYRSGTVGGSGNSMGSSGLGSGAGGPTNPAGNGRSSSSDANMPPWERYMTSAAAAEAYVADYMRTMHGQLPPLPFVPPFSQLPLTGAAGTSTLPAASPAGIYEQLPPPVRYYDGPPLPDYPPPQTMRPPPPSFDKIGPTYEDFAAWKNAGLPTTPGAMPPGFAGLNATGSGGNSGSGTANNSSNSGFGSGGPASSNSTGSGLNSSAAYRGNRGGPDVGNSGGGMRTRERGGNVGGRDYHHHHHQQQQQHHRGGSQARNAGGDREPRHFRALAIERGGGHRNYRDGRR